MGRAVEMLVVPYWPEERLPRGYCSIAGIQHNDLLIAPNKVLNTANSMQEFHQSRGGKEGKDKDLPKHAITMQSVPKATSCSA